jgi:hypothetical protein
MCIVTPYALTIASLICIIMVGLGCTDKSNSTLNDLFFFRVSSMSTPSRCTANAYRPMSKTSPPHPKQPPPPPISSNKQAWTPPTSN